MTELRGMAHEDLLSKYVNASVDGDCRAVELSGREYDKLHAELLRRLNGPPSAELEIDRLRAELAAVEAVTCDGCGELCADHTIRDGKRICVDCWRPSEASE